GVQTFRVYPTGTQVSEGLAPALSFQDLSLAADAFYTLIVHAPFEGRTALVLEDRRAEIPAGQAAARMVHVAAGLDPISMRLRESFSSESGEVALGYNVVFGAARPAVSVAAAFDWIGYIDVISQAGDDYFGRLTTPAAGSLINVIAVNSSDELKLLLQADDGSVQPMRFVAPPAP
ncbi:MAG TPA: DUF4397 domain-containing protein, partial [Myxococcaceae bacterium]|nr:DUF4397 domain-containing protein [Myxococcaceae bacterium]